ncbi:cytochrome P450 [Xylariaceae sp. FL1651]|nr:cytochrome P450 [Xylariaceae sp. FL1651]
MGAAILTLLWYVVSSIVVWNRLRHIPGPFFASFSYFWAFWCVSTGRSHNIIQTEQQKYGKIMRIGPDAIAISDPETLLRINGARSLYTRGPWYGSLKLDWRGDNLITELDTVKHDKRKSKLVSAFSGRGLVSLETQVDEWITALIRSIRGKLAKGEATMDIGMLLHYFQIDLITQAGLGIPWNDLADEKDHFGYLEMSNVVIPFLQAIAWLPAARTLYLSTWFMSLFGPKTTDKAGLGLFLGILEKEVESRFSENFKTGEDRRDLLGEWIKHGLSAPECQFDLALQIPAGSETSVTTIRGILLYLLCSPVVYQKVKQEIKDGIAAGSISNPVKNEEAKSLKYLQAVVQEGMRLVPPLNMGFGKRVPDSGDTICGKFVPAGTDVYPNYPSLMHSRDIFGADAEVFRPERFLSGPNVARMEKTVDMLFGNGRFMCLGKALALIELNKIFVQLLRNFDFQIANPEKPWIRVGYTSFLIGGFQVQVSEDVME